MIEPALFPKGPLGFGRLDQLPQSLFRPFPELTANKEPHQGAPPPGREMEVSIEPDETSSGVGLSKRHALVVVDTKWQVHEQIDPPALWVELSDLDRHRPLPAERRRGQVNDLTGLDGARRFGQDERGVVPITESLECGQNLPNSIRRRGRHRRRTDVDDHVTRSLRWIALLWPF